MSSEHIDWVIEQLNGYCTPRDQGGAGSILAEQIQVVLDEVERLGAVEIAARALMQAAADNVHTLAERGHRSAAFQAAGDQWHAAYSELKTALAAKEQA